MEWKLKLTLGSVEADRPCFRTGPFEPVPRSHQALAPASPPQVPSERTSRKFGPGQLASTENESALPDFDIFRSAGLFGGGGGGYDSIAHRLPIASSQADGGSGGGGAEWAWEAAAGPGPTDPFREDWKHWGKRGVRRAFKF